MNSSLETKRKAEKLVVDSIRNLSESKHIYPQDLDYSDWMAAIREGMQSEKVHVRTGVEEVLAAYKSLGTKFGVIKQANFKATVDSVNTAKVEIVRRAKVNAKETANLASEATFLSHLQEIGEKVLTGKITPVGFSKNKPKAKLPRHLNLILSDLHFHSLLDPDVVPVKYGPQEEARRLGAIVKQVCEYKEFYRNETQLNVHLLGDIIQNQLYDQRDGAPLAKQFGASIYLLIQALGHFAANFPKVVVRCATGNHGRNTARHKQRATLDKWDSIETMIYYALKQAVQHLPNVTVEIPLTPYFEYDSFGAISFGTHGDTVLNPGYPGSVINVKSLEQQANKISASRKDGRKYDLFFIGHVHTGALINLPSATFICNGALIPTDQYGVSIGLLSARCGQYLWESVPGHVVGDSRFIEVNEKTDQEDSLNKIIKPFEGF